MVNTNVWNHENIIDKKKYRHFPTDMMLRGIFSDQYFKSKNILEKGNVLDIGSLYSNNLVPFHDRKWNCFGTEVTNDSVLISKDAAISNNIKSRESTQLQISMKTIGRADSK